MSKEKEKENPQEPLQDFFSQMVSQTSSMLSPMDPLGAMKPLQQIAEAWTKNPQQFADAMQTWTEQIGDMNTRIWQEFLDSQNEDSPEGKQPTDLADLPYFTWIREYFRTYSSWMEQQIHETSGVSEKVKEDASFWSKQMLSALSPKNYFWTNPEAINAFIESKGESLHKGLQNWLKDQQRDGMPEMVDKTQFQVGGNLANTPGKIIYRNELIELIQYEPMTEEVHEIPIVITPPWINKYYILDLKPQKSFIRNLVSQGYTVFVISWKNPTREMRGTSMDDYLRLGPMKAIEAAKTIAKSKKVHAVGYCIGGTLLASAMASLNHPDNPQGGAVKDWTLLTTLVEFERPGELGSFINEESLEYLEDQMSKQGYLEGAQMGNTMRMLRADGLIWHYFVNNYLFGKQPPPVDLLFWNDDATRMPEKMHSFYLREYYLKNRLCKPDELELAGYPIDLRRIKQPLYCVSAEEDHITPWTQVFQINRFVKGPVRFVLSTSGHIAGVVNPPVDPPKRSFWAGDSDGSQEPETWQEGLEQRPGSWWDDWSGWLKERCGKMIPPPKMGSSKYKPMEDAPGTYVLET
jgi:polyhydroxyalkanoate synthase